MSLGQRLRLEWQSLKCALCDRRNERTRRWELIEEVFGRRGESRRGVGYRSGRGGGRRQ